MTRKTDFLLKTTAQTVAKVRSQHERDAAAVAAIAADLFLQQYNFIFDRYRRKSLLCPRRAGKTHTAVAHALITALENPGSTCVIVTLTLANASKLYWAPLKEMCAKYGIAGPEHFKVGERVLYLPNGSRVILCGAESYADIEKLRGGAYKLVIVDECKSLREEIFEELIFDIVIPATNDVSGTVCLIGTPGTILSGLFYRATVPAWRRDPLPGQHHGDLYTRDYYEPEEFWEKPPVRAGRAVIPAWHRHYWTVAENVFRPDIWKNALEFKDAEQVADNDPRWIREYLGKWVSSQDSYVYALKWLEQQDGFDACRCLWEPQRGYGFNEHGLPLSPSGRDDWTYILGMDLGFEDDSAFVVMAHSATNRVLYQVHEEKYKHLIVPQVVGVIRGIMSRFGGRVDHMVADMGAQGKMLVETMNQQYGLYIQPAEKTAKFDYIELLNSDLRTGRLKIRRGGENSLYDEWSKLQWDLRGLDRKRAVRTGRIREDQSADNHLSDACLYTWRFAYHHFSRTESAPPVPGSAAWMDSREDAWMEEAAREVERRKLTTATGPEAPWTQPFLEAEAGFSDFDQHPFNKMFSAMSARKYRRS